MSEDQFSLASSYDQSSEPSKCSGDIHQEDWNHARALINKYPPQIVLWIIRELLSSQPLPVWTTFATGPRMASAFSTTPSCPLMYAPSLKPDFNSRVKSHSVSTPVGASPTSQPSFPFESTNLNNLLHNDAVGVCALARSYVEEEGTLTTTNRDLTRQSITNMPQTQSIITTVLLARDKEGLNQQEKRWFCVYNEHQGKSFGKPSDWKKHMDNFHEPGKEAWQCPEKDCYQIFDKSSNFCQHHRAEHNCRKPCKHADSAKMRIHTRRAFACGCQSCQCLLFSWDDWRNHVAQHMENRMTISQWQYNTVLRNLLRRPEIHPYWERHVAQQVFPYNVPARFDWRPRNTMYLKRQLEYFDEVELSKHAAHLVRQAFETGLEVRSAQEISDSSELIAEPVLMQKQPQYSLPTLIDHYDNPSGVSTPSLFHQEPGDLQILSQCPPSFCSINDEHFSDCYQSPSSFKF
jgi:hypothetical protein